MIELMNPTIAYEKRVARIYDHLISQQHALPAFDRHMREIHVLTMKIKCRATDLGRGLDEFFEPITDGDADTKETY